MMQDLKAGRGECNADAAAPTAFLEMMRKPRYGHEIREKGHIGARFFG
jgi:hypothetical protein